MNTRYPAMVGALAASVLAPLAPAVAASNSAPLPTVAYSAYGFGSRVNVANGAVTSGPTGYSIVACTTVAPLTRSNSTAAVRIPGVGRIAALKSMSASKATASDKSSLATAETGSLNLFNGGITAGAVKTATTVRINSARVFTTQQSTTLVNLKINGRQVSANSAPNTTVSLKAGGVNVAKVVVNRQFKIRSATRASATTAALEITLLSGNPYGLPAGAVVRVSLSSATLDLVPVNAVFNGNGFATRATAANGVIKSGPTALAYVPCTGGQQTANVASVTIPGIVTTGTTTTVAKGIYRNGVATASVKQSIASPNVLAGLITADVIVAETKASRGTNGQITVADSSRFVGLSVLGQPQINDSVAPNTRVNLLGVGTLTLREQIKEKGKIRVTMIKLVLSKNIAGLPTGTTIEIGSSTSGIAR